MDATNLLEVRITVMRKACYADLMERYEQPLDEACPLAEGDVFVSRRAERPEGLCASAWETLAPFVRQLAEGGGRFYGDWMRNPRSALLSCNDGFRPVSFLVEALA